MITFAFCLALKSLSFVRVAFFTVCSTSNHVTATVNFCSMPTTHLAFGTSSTLGNVTSALSLALNGVLGHVLTLEFETAISFASFVV